MSVEALTVAKLVEDGPIALRVLYANNVSYRDFPIYEEEFKWIEARLARKKTLNRRVFRQKFPDFEWAGVPSEDMKDLAHDLKEERAYEEINALVLTLSERLERDNALDLAVEAREHLGLVTRKFVPMSDVIVEDWEERIQEMYRWRAAAKAGAPIGLLTGFPHLDHHWGGLLPGQFIEILGRSGEGKSLKMASMALNCKMQGARVGIFTPELSAHETICRVHTLSSAMPEVKAALGLERSFRNRALMFRRGFNIKTYQRFCEYFADELPGRMYILSGTGLSDQMSVGYIEDKIVEYELDIVYVDPIYLLKPVRMTQEGNTYQETAWTAEALHRLSESYDIPIVFTNQAHFGKAIGDAPDKSDSFGAKALVHLVDYVLGVKHISDENKMICKCSKSRFGQNHFRYELLWHANTGAIRHTTPLSGNYFNGKDDDFDEEDMQEVLDTAKQPQKGKTHG